MDRERAVAIVLLVLALGSVSVVGLGVLDPWRGGQSHELDLSESPTRIARDALYQTDERSYALHVLGNVSWVTNTSPGGCLAADRGGVRRGALCTYVRARVDAPAREFRSFQGDRRTAYANEYDRWYREDGTWTEFSPYRRQEFQRPLTFYQKRLVDESARVVVASRTEETLVLRIRDTRTAMALVGEPMPGNDTDVRRAAIRATLTLTIDVESRTLRRAEFRYSASPEGDRSRPRERSVRVYRFDDWGETDVRRPPGIGYSLREFLVDLSGT